ncbi:uncharacterized protein [Venturia canescens]|uniref:uncharacterized protein n=1 Tax=Venturia canescens TaxID=32260 RepID=UPI001C9D3090|nr:uncharacterized protein LOC122412012 [Venturia canescens]
MEVHDRLMNVPTTDLTILEIFTEDQERKSFIIREVLEVCNKKILNNCTDLKVLETFRRILCYEYQKFINSGIRWSTFDGNKNKIHLETFSLWDVECSTDTQEFALLYDVAVLQLAFNSKKEALIDLFKDRYDSQKERLAIEHESLHLCLRVLECVTDAYSLHSHLHKEHDQNEEFEQLPECIVNVLELWMKQETRSKWQILLTLLPKLILIFGVSKVVTPLWNKVLDQQYDLDKILDLLCVMADLCFPTNEEQVQRIHYEYSISTEFWLVLLRSLDSTIYQERKKGFYLMKRVLDFIESNESQIRNHFDTSKTEMVPFIHTAAQSKETVAISMKKYFFLILESSEEKQKHLVLPALTYLPDLVKGYSMQKSQCYHFHRKWLQCVFKRILQHDNIAIKKLGLQEILMADLDIYDDSLLEFLANFLNNILLYDFDYIEEKHPKIVFQLVVFFIKSERAQALLINSFVRAISKISWCPIAIRWILEALVKTVLIEDIVYNVWTSAELACWNNLMNCNFGSLHYALDNSIHENLWMVVCGYIPTNSYWPDVELITHTLNSYIKLPETYGPTHEYISKIIRASDAQLYVSNQCETLWSGQSTKSFATTIVVFATSDLILSHNNCSAKRSLHKLFETLNNVYRRLYIDKATTLKVLELLSYIMILAGEEYDVCMLKINPFLLQYHQAIVCIVESCIEKAQIPEAEHTLACKALILHDYCQPRSGHLKSFFNRCINFILNPNKLSKYHWMYALKAVNRYNTWHSYIKYPKFASKVSPTKIQSLFKYFEEEILHVRREDEAKTNDEFDKKIVYDGCKNMARFISSYIQHANFDDLVDSGFWLQNLQLLVEIGPEKTIIDVAQMICHPLVAHYQQLKTEDLSYIISITRLSCRLVFQVKKSKVFFDIIKQLTQLIVDSNFLNLNEAKEIAIKWVDQLMEEGRKVPNLRHTFITEVIELDRDDALLFLQPLIVCLFHGEVPRHDQKIAAAAMNHNDPLHSNIGKDISIRCRAVIAMMEFLGEPKELNSTFREKMLQEILLILKNHRNKRYFDNSHVHRLKHRAMQALLVLEPYLNDEEVRYLYEEMCELLITESNQPSVRLMQEWLLVRIYANSLMDESIWVLFEFAIEKRPGSLVSVSSIVYHISRLLKDEAKIKFISQAMSHLLPSCMSQQFNVRLYSQVIVAKLYEMLPEEHRYRYKIIFKAVQESLRHGNLTKNSPKVMDDFYFTEFHPNEDYNLEFIYEHLPRLTGLPPDEWIKASIWQFVHGHNYPIPQECSPKWKRIKFLKRPPKSAGGDSWEEIDSTNEGGLSDIQKKIIPWKSMTPFTDELSEVSKAALARKITRNTDAGIIVVASLIDRAPNLGGLARTCEIFGAKELVIGSLKYVEDREFQTLSMSAEKWITITEVKAHLLKNYLLEQRLNGWKLVGAEQTANSTNLNEMEFDKKTILLLGNEKDGIPANLIPLLDTCVEIPQNGVVRSLNVHVTGAICIWQYAKQHLFT